MQIQDQRTRVQSNQNVIRGRGVAKHDYGRTVEQHVRQALGRVSRIERHICAARLERRQHADQQFGTAPRIQCNAIVLTHAPSTQIVGQAVRTPIEFRVGQSTLVLNYRNRVRRARGLPFEQFVQAEPRWTCLFAGIPTTNDFFTLHFRQDVQLPQRPVRIALQRIDQPCQRDLEEIANARRIDACSRLRTHLEIVAVIVDVHADGVVGSLVPVEQFDAVGNMCGRDLRLAVPIVQQRREQRRLRRHPAATLRQHQRRMLVTHQFRQLRMRLLHARLHARLRYPHPHRQTC
ncbi:non-ribosomal peptide synthetase domain protein [Burkholderia pseudomallei MSHR3016]|nr:non-ribosomal peptide synthetase domain protein [Burkholderia pseudomallei MSHR3016]